MTTKVLVETCGSLDYGGSGAALGLTGAKSLRRTARQLKDTAIESLTLAVEIFNRPSPTARSQGVLLNLQHAFEMLFKAIVFEDRGAVCPAGSGKAHSFKTCLGMVRGLGVIDEDEAIVAATIDAHRDGVQHYGAAISEDRLYIDAASGVRLFDDVLSKTFGQALSETPEFASRMLPVATKPPREMHLLISSDVQMIRELLAPGKHRRAEARALLRTLVLAEQAARDPLAEVEQPTDSQLEAMAKRLQGDEDWSRLLPGLAKLSLRQDADATYEVKIVKSGNVPAVKLVQPGEPGAEDAVSILKYNELDRYPFYSKDLEKQTALNQYETRAMVHLLALKDDEGCFKVFPMGKLEHARFSHEALLRIRQANEEGRLDEAKLAYREHLNRKREPAT